jgi:phosphatidylserine/phosphatidylglycerophosphate/cardiolipin synthase-like enzyme
MRNRIQRVTLTAIAAGALLAAMLGPGSEAEAAVTGCRNLDGYTVCLTDPVSGKRDTAIADEIARRIGQTGKGDSIRAAAYSWTFDNPVRPIADAIIEAKQRGVDVRVVVGRAGSGQKQNDAVVAEFKRVKIPVTQCDGACLPNGSGDRKGPMHNRFFAIERDGKPTVITTTLNFTGFQTTQAHTMVAVDGDRKLYEFYSAYWHRLSKGSWEGWAESDRWRAGSKDRNRAWLFPRGKGDPIANQLGQVTGCSSGHDRIWVAHTYFQKNRPDVRERLRELQRMGCDVRIVLLDHPNNDRAWLTDGIKTSSVRLAERTRNKFLLIEAEVNGSPRTFVYAGTHNLTGNSLRNADDNSMRVGNAKVVAAYADYFDRLWKRACQVDKC